MIKKILFFSIGILFLLGFQEVSRADMPAVTLHITKAWIVYSNNEHDEVTGLDVDYTLHNSDETYDPVLITTIPNVSGTIITAIYLYATGTYEGTAFRGWVQDNEEPVDGDTPPFGSANFAGTTNIDISTYNKLTLRMYYDVGHDDLQFKTPVQGTE